jgi:nicotinamidase-related amidase
MTADASAAGSTGPDAGIAPAASADGGTGTDGTPWLAVIDMQRVFAEVGSPWRTPKFAQVVGPVKDLVAHFGRRVTFTRFVAPDKPEGGWRRYYEQWPFALQPPDARIYELVDDFGRRPTLDATTFGKWGPELAAQVGAGPLVLCGVSTDCCVLSTALAAADAGVEVQVVIEACAGFNDDSHEKALDIMRLYAPLVEVVTLADVSVP